MLVDELLDDVGALGVLLNDGGGAGKEPVEDELSDFGLSSISLGCELPEAEAGAAEPPPLLS